MSQSAGPASIDDRPSGLAGRPRRIEAGPALRSAVLGIILVANPVIAREERPSIDTTVPRGAGTQALIASLRARVLAADSATLALEGWCAEHRLAGDPRLVAERLAVPDKPLTEVQRARLAIGPDEPVRYRRVRLACGDHLMSEADNWYVPARLTPAMNAALEGTRTPFGRVVRPLAPTRRTIAVRPLTTRADPGPDEPLFSIEAVLSTGAGEPFCEVAETYLGGALPAPSP